MITKQNGGKCVDKMDTVLWAEFWQNSYFLTKTTRSVSSGVTWHTATHLSGISATLVLLNQGFTIQWVQHSEDELFLSKSDSSQVKQHLLPHLPGLVPEQQRHACRHNARLLHRRGAGSCNADKKSQSLTSWHILFFTSFGNGNKWHFLFVLFK